MKRTLNTIILVCLPFIFPGCGLNTFEVGKSYREQVAGAFSERMERFGDLATGMKDVMELHLTNDERFALEFMYAYMPLSDLADYSGEFHLANVQQAIRSRTEMPWGAMVPGEIFLHFVLPQRVNNENLDSFRLRYYDEISSRLHGIDDIGKAALEINHWCHEKVTYQPADIRTSAPMSTMLSARGRCGEESTFTVAALRCAGIPARQVYTPRWAHSDDNHAWVEVWVDGEWSYLGACEPEPVLDRGWFTEPARRAMLIHTKTFGAYRGDENTIFNRNLFSEINNLSKYAVTRDIVVKVSNQDGSPASMSVVEFQLYNYAEFYPLASVTADSSGQAGFRTGLGDLLVWARKGDEFDFKKISVVETDTIWLVLSAKTDLAGRMEFDLFAPLARTPLPGISSELADANASRIRQEDLVRQSYTDSWISLNDMQRFAENYNYDNQAVEDILKRSMGNYMEIISFLEMAAEVDRDMAIDLMQTVAAKDLRDTPGDIFMDHLVKSSLLKHDGIADELFISTVLNPRVANEIITPWRSAIRSELDAEIENFSNDPALIAPWLKTNIKINLTDNYYNVPVSPSGVLKLGEADVQSLHILFVALCRTAGIPARLEPGTLEPQYYYGGKWNNTELSDAKSDREADASLVLKYNGNVPVPEYYIHFTIAKFRDGRYNTLDYNNNKKVTEFTEPLKLEPGRYMIVTGNRLDDTRVLASVEFFSLQPGETVTMEICPRTVEEEPAELGNLDMKLLQETDPENASHVPDYSNGVVMAWIEKGKEPSVHILNDLPLLKQEFDEIGTAFLFLSVSDKENDAFSVEQLKSMPSNSISFADPGMKLLSALLPARDLNGINYPYIVYADSDGSIMFRSEGYRIGIGEQIIKRMK